MIKLINIIIKFIIFILFFPIGALLTIISIIFWNSKYINVADDILIEIIEGKM